MRNLLIASACAAALLTTTPTAEAARPNRDATLTVNPSAPVVGDALVFSGCGYEPGGAVGITVLSPYANSFTGAIADSEGCFSTAVHWVYTPNEVGDYTALTFQSRNNKPDATATFSVAP